MFQDPTATEASVSSINDVCTPMTMRAMFLGTTAGGETRARNPSSYTNFHLNWTMSHRDLDQDGRENSYDTCPHVPDTGTDADGDLLDFACDPDDTIDEGLGCIFLARAGDFDCDGFSNGQDNCPQVANGNTVSGHFGGDGQAQDEINQSYAVAAADGGPKTDGMGDVCEGAGGGEYGTVSFTQNGFATTIATSDTVSNGRFHVSGIVIAKCFGGTDSDGDGYCKEDEDNFDATTGSCSVACTLVKHKAWSGGLLSLDTDSDYISDFRETYLGTDGARPCADTGLGFANDEAPLDNWPFDFNDDGRGRLFDVLSYIAVFNQVAETPTTQRYDLTADGLIGLGDVLSFIPFFGYCTTVPQQ
ncbi:MAG: thrombospondin type 3 repeat-containing protein [Chloroflexi bacterium]|nr:thrombospondin type 3 repeat-containing protein [Chloroflexota bacterium]